MKRITMLVCCGLPALGLVAPTNAEVVTDAAMTQVLLDVMVAPIHSKAELDRYLVRNPDSPIHGLGDADKQSFLSSLVFSGRGLASYSYLELEGRPASEVYRILALFGLQSESGSIRRRRSLSAEDRMVESGLRSARPPRRLDQGCWVTPYRPGRCHHDPGHECSALCP